MANYEGLKAEQEQEKQNVYRVDPQSGAIKVVVDDFVEPNGLAFSPDEKKLYIVDTGYSDGPDNPAHIRVFDVDIDSGKLANGRVFAEDFKPSNSDGVRCDIDGNVWCSMGWGDPEEDGVRCYAPDGDLVGKIHIPETCANLCFGGRFENRLYICGSTSLYASTPERRARRSRNPAGRGSAACDHARRFDHVGDAGKLRPLYHERAGEF